MGHRELSVSPRTRRIMAAEAFRIYERAKRQFPPYLPAALKWLRPKMGRPKDLLWGGNTTRLWSGWAIRALIFPTSRPATVF
jgi:hypothetical protein